MWLQSTTVVLLIAFLVAFAVERSRLPSLLPALLTTLVAASMLVLVALIANHVPFPFQLDLMEGAVMQHAKRVVHGQSIYPLPSPEFVPLAYNALYYVLAAPFLLLFGETLQTLRVLSVIGLIGSALAIFVIVRAHSRSVWWGMIGVGLFCSAYAAMDAYLDTAHSDSWLLCSALWGTYLVGRASRGARVAGILALIAAFWFKQHGAVFLFGALVYLTWQEGIRGALVYWLMAITLGALLYVVAPGSLLGPGFHYFTWYVPSGWSEIRMAAFIRVARYLKTYYPVLALASALGIYRALRARSVGILDVQMGAALVTAVMGSLDPGSSTNVFIPVGAFCILCGTIELARVSTRSLPLLGVRLGYAAALLAFATLLSDPRAYWLPDSKARAAYAELQSTILSLPGVVYAPGIGQFVRGPHLYPTAHWIALEDIMRGPRRTASDSALARRLLDPVRNPDTTVFVITNFPLESMSSPTREIAPRYSLVQDWGNRYASLSTLPRPWNSGWPRYLYRISGHPEATHGH
jgi:hypothetical protein